MRKRLLLALLAVALFWVYRTASIYAICYISALPIPAWWLQLVPRAAHGILVWTFMWNTIAVLVVALPMAWVLARFYGRIGVYLGAIAALALVAPDIVSTARVHELMSPLALTVDAVDFLKIAIILPLLVWAFLRLPSNSRLSGP